MSLIFGSGAEHPPFTFSVNSVDQSHDIYNYFIKLKKECH